MRPKVVISVLLAAVALLAGVFFLKSSARHPATEAPVEVVAVEKPSPEVSDTRPASPIMPVTPQATIVTPKPEVPGGSTNTAPVAVVEDPAYIRAQVDRLEDLMSNDDAASLQGILTELTNSSPVIRHTAIEAAIQFGDRSAIPTLKALAARTDDPAEKKELLDAANFMALPTISEVRAQKKLEPMQGGTSPQPTHARPGRP
jgi:hypothetical protein